MARAGVTLMCYWNGKMTNGPQGISYEGASPKPVRVSYEITHNALLEKMYAVTGFDRQQSKLKIICRYPACRDFIPVPIEDDESIDIIFDIARQPGTNCLELYLQREPISNDNQANVTVRSNSQANVRVPVYDDNQIKVTVRHDGGATARAPVSNAYQVPTNVVECNVNADCFLDPGPVKNSVLVLQKQHRSEAIWSGQDSGVLTCRQSLGTMMREWQLDQRLLQYIIQSGFYGVYRIGFIQLDWPLITALVERWRQETHTFHFAVGESTITLQDVAVLLGIRIHGQAVTGSSDLQWDDLCEELLGVKPDSSVLHGSGLRLSWLRAQFKQLPPNADDLTLKCYARAYILGLMGCSLFADKSGSHVQLIFLPLLRDFAHSGQVSWGSAVLARLYRALCRASRKGAIEIAGPLFLMQLWAWERLHIGRPERFNSKVRDSVVLSGGSIGDVSLDVGEAMVNEEPLPADPLGCRWKSPVIRRDDPDRALIFYRDQLDQQTDDQILWRPYTPELVTLLSDECVKDQHIWRAIVPLVCFDIVEWHRPDRVLRQFGLHQGIPVHCNTEVELHKIDRRSRHHYKWQEYHKRYIELWESREENIAPGELTDCPMHFHDPYMEWYRSITRRLIAPLNQKPHKGFQPSSGTAYLLVQSLTTIHNQCSTALDAFSSDRAKQALADMQSMCTRVLEMIGETRQLQARPFPPSINTNVSSEFVQEIVPHPNAATSIGGRGSRRGKCKSKGRDRGKSGSLQTITQGESLDLPEDGINTEAAELTSDPTEGSSQVSEAESGQLARPKKKKKS